ncbi:hypothetical protein LXL04_032448 [Taraxacum kok-saghyz]
MLVSDFHICCQISIFYCQSSKMDWESPADAMPWVGLYVFLASLICTLAMAADVYQGFRQWKLWFPCRFFTMNAASITLIGIAMKPPVDLSTDISHTKIISLFFMLTMFANFLPSLGLMDDKELLMNIIAFGILIITISVNVWIQFSTRALLTTPIQMLILLFPIPWPFSVALTVSATRRILQNQYKELHRFASSFQEINFSTKELKQIIQKYWMMAETGNPQFAIACSPVASALGVISSPLAFYSFYYLIFLFTDQRWKSYYKQSDYKWSMRLIVMMQLIGVIVGSIAPFFRCLAAVSHFNLSQEWSTNHLNVFRVEKQWIQMLQLWKSGHAPSHIPGRHFKKVFHNIKNLILNVCIAFQIMVVVICNILCLIPRFFLIVCSCCGFICKSLLKRFKEESNATDSNVICDPDEYNNYVLQVEQEAKLSKRILRNALSSITRLLQESETKEPKNLMELLKKSIGFHGVVRFDNDQVPPLHSEEIQNCWSLATVTLTAIAVSLPNTVKRDVKVLLSGMREGLQFVWRVEESLNTNDDLVKSRKAARRVWTDIDVYSRWLLITDLQKKACKGEMSKEILHWLGDEAIKIVIQFMRSQKGSLDHSLTKFLAANAMYRISQTILLHCDEQENWPTDEEIFEFISTMIADLLCACFTNLPRVITMKCHHDALEKREESIRTTAQLLGRSKNILKILKGRRRQIPNLDMDSMGYIDTWHALPNNQILNGFSSTRNQQHSSSFNDSFVVTIM